MAKTSKQLDREINAALNGKDKFQGVQNGTLVRRSNIGTAFILVT